MIVEFKVTLDEMHTLVDMMMAEHEEYYGTPSNADRAFANGLGFYETNAGFGWRSSQGNDLHLHQDLGGWTAIYRGRRHGLRHGGFLRKTLPILEEVQRRGDWRYTATSEKGWLPLEVEEDAREEDNE